MAGLWAVSFKPGNWLGGTRLLTPEQRGVYIDLLCMIYEKGGPIEDSPTDLCRILGYRYHAKLARVLTDLEARDKIWRRDGLIGNKTADEYLARVGAATEKSEAGASPVRKPGEAKPVNTNVPASSPERPASVARPSLERPSTVARATTGKNASFQSPDPPNLNPVSSKESLSDRASELPRASVPDSDCRPLIDAFDDARAAEWGPMQRRAMPAGIDWRTAREWVADGADAALVAEVAKRAMVGMHRRNFLPKTLSILTDDIRSALAERREVAAAGPFDPERNRWASKMTCFERGSWLDGWGPEPGKPGCDMPQHLQDEIIHHRNKVA